MARATGVGLPAVFVVLQILSLALLASAGLAIARVLYRHQWSAVGLLAALTLRHAISKSGTNTLEGYFHPRQLAFAIGALAMASFLRGHPGTTWLLVALAGALHPTTALWFAIWLGVATIVGEPRLRLPMIAGVAIAALAGAWGFYAGPLAGRLVVMDPVWLETLASKDYLFPLRWPAAAWLVNLGYIPLIVWIYRRRRADGLLVPRETAIVVGCLSLVLVFAATLPFNAMRVALAIQLQPARIFWMLDLLAVVYVVWVAAEGRFARSTRGVITDARRARLVALLIALVSAARGAYIMLVEFPDRRVAQISIADDDWGRAMAWARASEPGSGWLANPDHAARYGTSVRVAAERDVYVEAIKDGAVGMYDRSGGDSDARSRRGPGGLHDAHARTRATDRASVRSRLPGDRGAPRLAAGVQLRRNQGLPPEGGSSRLLDTAVQKPLTAEDAEHRRDLMDFSLRAQRSPR